MRSSVALLLIVAVSSVHFGDCSSIGSGDGDRTQFTPAEAQVIAK